MAPPLAPRHAPVRAGLAALAAAVTLVATAASVAAQQDRAQTAALPPQAQATPTGVATTPVVSVIDLIGRPVVGPGGERVAVVHDMVFSTADGRVRAALAPLGGGGLVAAPTESLRLTADGSLLVNADRAGLARLPPLDPAALAGAQTPEGELLVRGQPLAVAPQGR